MLGSCPISDIAAAQQTSVICRSNSNILAIQSSM